MKKKLSALFALLSILLIATLAGCSSKKSASSNQTLTMVFYPNESAKDFNASRTAIKQQLKKATGKKIKIQTTTDYNIAIEAIASGTLKDAAYHSYFMVPKGKEAQYQNNGQYSIDNIKGKKISFVSVSSTSGHLIPVAAIQSKFNLKNSDELSQNGHFFKSVLFGNSHQGSAVNLFNGDADVAVFDDIDTNAYINVAKGSWTKVGSEFRVKDNATAPFISVRGKESVAIAISPVQNGPFVANTDKLSKKDQENITKAFTSKAVTDNPKILSPKDAQVPAIWKKESSKSQLLKVTNDWYAPTNKLVAKN